MSTLEGLIQSISTSITNDLIKPLWSSKKNISDKQYLSINKIAIVVLAIASFIIARNQLLQPKLSVAILAQNGSYAYFSTLFVPILMGIFVKNVRKWIPFIAAIVATAVHFGVFYFLPYLHTKFTVDFGWFNKYIEGDVRNPAIAASTAIVLSIAVGFGLHFIWKLKPAKIDVANS